MKLFLIMATQVFKLFNFKGENQFLPFNHLIFYFISGTVWTQQGKRECIYLTPLYHFHPLHKHLARQLLQRAQLCTKLAAGITLGTFGFEHKSLTTKLHALERCDSLCTLCISQLMYITAYVNYVYH